MSVKLEPQGTKILVLPLETKHAETEGGLTIVDTELTEGEIAEVSAELSEIYKKGDKILFPKAAGTSQFYNHKAHLWLNGTGAPMGDVWAIIK